MNKTFRYYMDDSGSPNPDHVAPPQNHSLDWFALGGILIEEARQKEAEEQIRVFREKWPQISDAPLHSYEIRNRSGAFRWLKERSAWSRFMRDLTKLMVDLPYHAIAAVVHRPGYNARYSVKYGRDRWMMCKTAFAISVERAAKFARHHNARLRVYVERSSPDREQLLRSYYEALKVDGLPFDERDSAKYHPLSASELRQTLFEFQLKPKQSALMQIADLALWPVCQGGYDATHRPYQVLCKAEKLLESVCPEGSGLFGTKYSCFDA